MGPDLWHKGYSNPHPDTEVCNICYVNGGGVQEVPHISLLQFLSKGTSCLSYFYTIG